jgi:hypothetical protein
MVRGAHVILDDFPSEGSTLSQLKLDVAAAEKVLADALAATKRWDARHCHYPGYRRCPLSGGHQFIHPFTGRLYNLCAKHYRHARRMANGDIRRNHNTCVVQ